jgi:CopG family nickel-responsive transcriptional regulator
MDQLERFGVSMPAALLTEFDAAIAQASYRNRSEAIRDIVRDYLIRQQWDTPEGHVVGTITIVYDHHTRELQENLTALQHEHAEAIICATHVHMDHHHCLEVIVVRGQTSEVKAISDRLLSTRGVKHGGLTATATGELH